MSRRWHPPGPFGPGGGEHRLPLGAPGGPLRGGGLGGAPEGTAGLTKRKGGGGGQAGARGTLSEAGEAVTRSDPSG